MTDDASSHVSVACAVLHTDGEGNIIPCPGYPHTEPEAPWRQEDHAGHGSPCESYADGACAAGPVDPVAEARQLLAEHQAAQAAACAVEVQAVLDKYGMQLEISTPAVTISPKP